VGLDPIILKLAAALCIGLLIGAERERRFILRVAPGLAFVAAAARLGLLIAPA
jgi:hypothetical protein